MKKIINESDQEPYDSERIGYIEILKEAEILKYSHGEIKKADTLSYRSFVPVKDGLFCQSIFGPTENYQCMCKKYVGKKYEGIKCEKCGVEVLSSNVRRKRFGHIKLNVPVFNMALGFEILSLILNIKKNNLIKAMQGDGCVSTEDHLNFKFSEEEAFGSYSDTQGMYDMISKIDMQNLLLHLNKHNRTEASKHLKNLMDQNCHLTDLWIKNLLVIPCALRPIMILSINTYISHDLNTIYRRIIHRNDRYHKFNMHVYTPDAILKIEKRLILESVNSLLWNGRYFNAMKESNKALKSIGEMFGGKKGIVRNNILGKRVDFSGRSVIVIDPTLRLNEAGIPKKILTEIFKPIIINQLIQQGYNVEIKDYNNFISHREDLVDLILENIKNKYKILINRAPTLFRLGIQAFKIRVNDHNAIALHPLVCKGFNADFDGDQGAIHALFSEEAIREIDDKIYLKNLFNPANGELMAMPVKDVLLGLYLLTMNYENVENVRFGNVYQCFNRYNVLENVIYSGVYIEDKDLMTTVGRIFLYVSMERSFGIKNDLILRGEMNKELINDLIGSIRHDVDKICIMLDFLKQVGFEVVSLRGISFNIDDLDIFSEDEMQDVISKYDEKMYDLEEAYEMGVISKEGYGDSCNKEWNTMVEDYDRKLEDYAEKNRKESLFTIINSKVRGSISNIRQISCAKGMVFDIYGHSSNVPIVSSYIGGLSPIEYFLNSKEGRRVLSDRALSTAKVGYLTRKAAESCYNIRISEVLECDSKGMGCVFFDFENAFHKLNNRFLSEEIILSNGDKIGTDVVLKEDSIKQMLDDGIHRVKIRSPAECNLKGKVCRKCFGVDPSTEQLVEPGFFLGIVAAQSMTEPGQQATMMTLHKTHSLQKEDFNDIIVKFKGSLSHDGKELPEFIDRFMSFDILNEHGDFVTREYFEPYTEFDVKKTKSFKFGDKIGNKPIRENIKISPIDGIVYVKNINSKFVKVDSDRMKVIGGAAQITVKNDDFEYSTFVNDRFLINVKDGQKVNKKDVLCELITMEGELQDIKNATTFLGSILDNVLDRRSFLAPFDGKIELNIKSYDNVNVHVVGENENIHFKIPICDLAVFQNMHVKRGDLLNYGSIIDLNQYYQLFGRADFIGYVSGIIDQIYINNKIDCDVRYIETLCSKMILYEYNNDKDVDQSKAEVRGITQVQLRSNSFLSAAAFQHTTQIFIKAALAGRTDQLNDNLKGQVVLGIL